MASNNLTQNVIAASLLHFLKKRYKLSKGFKLKMTPHVLFKALKSQNNLEDFANPEFPDNLTAFAKKIYQLTPSFKKVGITIARKHSGNREIIISAEEGEIDANLL